MNREAGQPEQAGPGRVMAAAADDAVGPIEVDVVYAPPGAPVDLTRLQMPRGSTVAQALEASGVQRRHGLAAHGLDVGVWGRRVPLHTALRAQDRVEVYRPLQCDPKEARRLRYRGQAKGRRPGTSAG